MFNKDLMGYKGFSRAHNHETQDSTTSQLSTPSAVGCPPGGGPTVLPRVLHGSTSCMGLCWGESRSQAVTGLDSTYGIDNPLCICAAGANSVNLGVTHRDAPGKQATGGSPASVAMAETARLKARTDRAE